MEDMKNYAYTLFRTIPAKDAVGRNKKAHNGFTQHIAANYTQQNGYKDARKKTKLE